MLEKFPEHSKKIFKYKKTVIVLFVLITAALAPGLFTLEMDNELINMIPESHPARIDVKKYQDIFGGSSLMFIGIEADDIYTKKVLGYIKKFTPEIEKLNSIIPEETIARLFNTGTKNARKIINVISELSYLGEAEMMEKLTDKQALMNEYFVEEKTASLIARRAGKIGAEKIKKAYELPIREVSDILSTDFIKGEGDKFKVEKIYGGGEFTKEKINRIKKRAGSWDLYEGGIASKDGTIAAIMVQVNEVGLEGVGRIYEKIEGIIKEMPPPKGVNIHIGGEPVISYQISNYMRDDMRLLIPLVAVIVILTLYFSFRRFSGVFFPMASVGMAVIWSLGIMSYSGIPLNVVSTVMPVLLIAVGSAYGIHFMNFYYMNPTRSREKAINDNMSGVGAAIMLAGITTFAGFGSLSTAGFSLIKHFGIFTSLGVIFVLLAALYFIPACLLMSKKEKPVFEVHTKGGGFINRLLSFLSGLSVRRYRAVTAVVILVIAVSIYGITQIKVEMDEVGFFKKGSEVRETDAVLNKKLAGTQTLDIVIEKKDGSEVIEPEILRAAGRMKKEAENKFSFINKDFSLNEYLKKMNQEMHGGKKSEYKLPETKREIRDYLLLYSGSLDSVLSPKKDMTRVTLVMNRTDTNNLKKLKSYIESYFSEKFLKKHNAGVTVTGYGNLYIVSNELIVSYQIRSVIISLAVIFVINLLVFRAAGLTGASLAPILTTVLMIFGMMGIFGIPLNAGTAMIACVAIGTGIDYAIHFLVKYRKERAAGEKTSRAIENTVKQTGRGILYNIFSVTAGFLVLTLSKFVPLMQFGSLIAFSMLATGFGALVIIPSLLKIFSKNTS